MQDLMVQNGTCTMDELIKNDDNIPQPTRTYCPITNANLIDMLSNASKEVGIELSDPRWGLARDGKQAFGIYTVSSASRIADDALLKLGVRNSFDKSLSVDVCFGSEVMVCDNLCFYGYAGDDGIVGRITHKHTTHVVDNMWNRLLNGLQKMNIFHKNQENFFNHLKEIELDDDAAYGIILRGYLAKAIPAPGIKKAAHAWKLHEREPENEEEAKIFHPEFRDRTAFSLFNMITEGHKEQQEKSPIYANERSLNLTRFFANECMN